MTTIDLGDNLGHVEAQILPSREPRAAAAAGATTSGLVAGKPSGVLPTGSGRRAGSCRDPRRLSAEGSAG